MPWYPKAIFGVIAVLLLAMVLIPRFRGWAFRADVRWLVAFHLTRFVGFYFLYLYSKNELPYDFAVLGGIGDIIIATLAIPTIFFARVRPAFIAWNIVGLLDIMAVASSVLSAEKALPGSMHQLDHLPLILLPTFAVPVIIVTHSLMLLRAARSRNSSYGM